MSCRLYRLSPRRICGLFPFSPKDGDGLRPFSVLWFQFFDRLLLWALDDAALVPLGPRGLFPGEPGCLPGLRDLGQGHPGAAGGPGHRPYLLQEDAVTWAMGPFLCRIPFPLG